MKYKSRLTGRNRTMLTVANDSMQRSRSRRRTREATRKVFLLGILGGVVVIGMLFFTDSNEVVDPLQEQDAFQHTQVPQVRTASSVKSLALAKPAAALHGKPIVEKAVVLPKPRLPAAVSAPGPVKLPAPKEQADSKTTETLSSKPILEIKPAPAADTRLKQMVSDGKKKKVRVFPGVNQVLSKKLFTLFDDYDVPEAAVAVVDIKTGEVLSALGYEDGELVNAHATRARWPAASVFKIVTASALMGKGLHSKSEICFNGGFRPITAADLRGTTGNTCASMKTAFSRSYNVPFARWSNAFLSRSELAAEAHAFGFQRPSALGLSKSAHGNLEIPLDKLKRAGTAAGFGDIHLSPLHGALMAAAVGNGGVARKPVWTADKATTEVRLFPSSRSRALRQMMVATVTSGTARKTFKEQGKPALGEHGAGGKTGTLGHRGRDLSWFVGFAPAENPRYAVGAYVANRPTWRIRASYVGREALRSALLKTSPYRPKSSSLASR
jgi:peptidoglycan glycosyltransferase